MAGQETEDRADGKWRANDWWLLLRDFDICNNLKLVWWDNGKIGNIE